MGMVTKKIETIANLVLKNGPIKLTAAVTYACNLHCKTCNIWKIYRNNPKKIYAELSSEEWQKLFQRANRTRYVSITGGEPTLRPDLPEILEAIDSNPKIASISVNTNGAIVERILDAEIRNTYLRVHVSVMGTEHVDDMLRGQGAHRTAMKAIKRLIDAGIDTFVEFTASEWNRNNLQKVIHEAEALGLPREKVIVTYFSVGDYYRNNGDEASRPLYVAKEALNMGSYSIETLPFLLLSKKHGKGTTRYCVAAKKSLFIDPYGDVYPCIFRLDVKLGNLRDYEYSIDEIYEKNSKKAQQSVKNCAGCWTPCETITGMAAQPWKILLP